MTLLGIDVGTTNLKVGAFDRAGAAHHIASRAMAAHRAPDGHTYLDAREVWQQAAAAIQEVVSRLSEPVAAIGIASMAETGVLIDRRDGRIRSEMLPWFDTAAQPQAAALEAQLDPRAFFVRTGLLVSYKCSVAKLLWLRERDPAALAESVWLSAADYIAYCLTGEVATDYSLASRTCAFNIEHRVWEEDWLESLGFPPDIFAPAVLAGTPVGTTSSQGAAGVPAGVPVAVCGHDHVCGAFAAGAGEPGTVFDSMGTAEALVGAMPSRPLTGADYDAGLMVGCNVLPDQHYWMGGLSTSGGAVEWLRAQLSAEPLSYAELLQLLDAAPPGPTGILFFPYLLGSASPHRDPLARGAWVGLRASHTRADLAKAVLEGAAYEIAFIRQVGERTSGRVIDTLTVAGGGTRNRHWLQIKADVAGCQLRICDQPEVVLLGAALLAGVGSGYYTGPANMATIGGETAQIIEPDPARHEQYRALFEEGYLPLQEPLRRFSRFVSGRD